MSRIEKLKQVVHLAVAMTLAGCACGTGQLALKTGQAPGVPILTGLKPSFGPLPEGVTASYPSFEGDAFSAVLTVRPQESLLPETALQEIVPVLRALGFTRSLEELGSPDEPLRIPSPDLAGLAKEVCGEASLQDPTSRETCDAMRDGVASERADEVIRNAYGIGFAELKADFETPVLQYPFRQLAGGVPIEGAGFIASRQEGKSLSTVHGALFNRYVVMNRLDRYTEEEIVSAGLRALGKRLGNEPLPAGSKPQLVAVPYGSGRLDGEEVPALRYAWRILLADPGEGRSWMAWIDAETGALLDLAPQFDGASVSTRGERWRRDPGLPTESRTFEVNPATGGKLTLRLDGAFQQVDRRGDGFFSIVDEVAVSGSSFDVSPINNEAAAICKIGGNPAFRQVHAYSHLYSFRKMVVDAGIFPSFPVKPVRIWVDHPNPEGMAFYDYPAAGDENSVLRFPEGSGFGSGCPSSLNQRLNGVHDATTLAHEMSHLSVKRLQERRPSNWCASAGCQLPNTRGRLLFHDFADALAAAYTSTNCFSGWTDKNWGGVNKTRYCTGATSETWGMPRLADVTKDRFPEHRNPATPTKEQPYADGQIAAAAIWRVRQGLRSKEGSTGTILLWERLHDALWNYSSFMSPTCTSACDRDIYRYLQNLETRMVDEWVASALLHTVNKVMIGWAEAGIFLVPLACLDGSSSTKVLSACPLGEGGGDAVIQVLDRDPADDLVIDSVTHPEWDYLERVGLPPRFRVWTGPRFRFNAAGKAFVGSTFPCHSRLQVEAASDAGFTSNLWKSRVTTIPTVPGCYAELDLPVAAWNSLRGAGGEARIYYRVRTWDASNSNERISTSPGAGAFNVPAPFFIVNDSGTP